ncbi:MAG: FAD-dependent oxidoreductase [Verrucomicrobiota bacterium]|nr:FAD-dependent oxidoreductase [Verrucomicrobiota bacterium]
MKPRLAIIGTGISGLACGHFLHKDFDIHLYEQNEHIGGHSLTVEAKESTQQIPIDMGFMVFNRKTYPNLTRLFDELNVCYKNSNMSFSVQHLSQDLEYCGSSLNHLFGQRKNIFNPRHWRMLMQINRFNNEARETLDSGQFDSLTLEEYVEVKEYGEDFFRLYIVPMSSAIWSTPPKLMLKFPATTLLRFFDNHGFLGMNTQHQWLTPEGGSREYVKKLTAPFADRISIGNKIRKIERAGKQATVYTGDGQSRIYDKVILASHADQSLGLLDSPKPEEKKELSKFKYQKNIGTLHTDPTSMPQNKLCWASWNYRIKENAQGELIPRTIYWMNNLQNVSQKTDYFVSINGEDEINSNSIIKQVEFEHPLFDTAAVQAQHKLHLLNQCSPEQTVYFCGSYFKYGFHEDALNSALDLCSIILGRSLWN